MDTRYNVVVIGGGSAGLISAYMCAAVKAKVALVEKHRMGGDCLNTGCVPSKALLRSAHFVHDLKRHQEFGVKDLSYTLDFAQVMERVQKKIQAIEPHDSVERYTQLGVDCIKGNAEILDTRRVRVGDQILQAKHLILALGASPLVPPIEGLAQIPYLTSDNLWNLRELPGRLLVLGGGPIGCEMAQAFARFGSAVTLVEMLPQLLSKEDEDAALLVQKHLEHDGVRIMTSSKALSVQKESNGYSLKCQKADGTQEAVGFDHILLALGRKANTASINWSSLGIQLNPNGTIKTDAYLRTTQSHIYACGDVTGPYQLTHAASHQAWYCAMNALFSPFVKFKADYRVLPWVTFTDPEIAQVGLNEKTAKAQGIPYEVSRYELDDLDRAITDSAAHGFVKVLTVPGKDKILGVTICAHLAGELIGEWALAMKNGLGLRRILGTVHAYPSYIEANKAVAGVWARAHVPAWSTGILQWYHQRRR